MSSKAVTQHLEPQSIRYGEHRITFPHSLTTVLLWLQYTLAPNHCLYFLITDNCLFTVLPPLYHFLRTPSFVVSTFRIHICLSTYVTIHADIFDRSLRLMWLDGQQENVFCRWLTIFYEILSNSYCLKLIQFYVGTKLPHGVKLKMSHRIRSRV